MPESVAPGARPQRETAWALSQLWHAPRSVIGWAIIASVMRASIPVEVALEAFLEEHRCCGELDAGVEDERVWMSCECGAGIVRALQEEQVR